MIKIMLTICIIYSGIYSMYTTDESAKLGINTISYDRLENLLE